VGLPLTWRPGHAFGQMILGFVTSYPANSWLISHGIKEGM